MFLQPILVVGELQLDADATHMLLTCWDIEQLINLRSISVRHGQLETLEGSIYMRFWWGFMVCGILIYCCCRNLNNVLDIPRKSSWFFCYFGGLRFHSYVRYGVSEQLLGYVFGCPSISIESIEHLKYTNIFSADKSSMEVKTRIILTNFVTHIEQVSSGQSTSSGKSF